MMKIPNDLNYLKYVYTVIYVINIYLKFYIYIIVDDLYDVVLPVNWSKSLNTVPAFLGRHVMN